MTLTPVPVATATDVINTTKGTVHMVIGGGGTSVPSNQLFFNPPQCRVVTAVGEPDPKTAKHPPVYVKSRRLGRPCETLRIPTGLWHSPSIRGHSAAT